MKIDDIPFEVTDWAAIEPTVHPGATGQATWRTRQCGAIRVRMVDYSPGYLADHWCEKGHILLCLEGRMDTELADGRVVTLPAGTFSVTLFAPSQTAILSSGERRCSTTLSSASRL